MKLMNKQRITDEDAEPRSHTGRRRFLGVVGGGGLATAVTVFGFAPAASAHTISYGCCHLCCHPIGKTLAQCESGFHYVWQCAKSSGGTCHCCEHQSPCSDGCSRIHYSVGICKS